jgi:hypothetical protein
VEDSLLEESTYEGAASELLWVPCLFCVCGRGGNYSSCLEDMMEAVEWIESGKASHLDRIPKMYLRYWNWT